MLLTALQSLSQTISRKTAGFLFVTFVGLAPLAQAAETLPATATPAMWKIQEDGKPTVYFLGSFHVLPKTMTWYKGEVEKAFSESDVFVMETVLDEKGQGEVAMLMMTNSMLPQGYLLSGLLDEDHYAKALKLTQPMGLTEAQVNRLQPWYLAILLSVQTIIANGLDPQSGVDHFLQDLAQQGGKTVTGLETTKEQIEALAHHPLEVQTAMLSDTLDKMDQFDDYMHSYISAWASGDAEKIDQTMVEEMKTYPSMYEALLVNRNKKWVPGLVDLIKAGKPTMVVVGMAHLVGEDSVLNMLMEKGYRVERVQ